MAPGVVTSIGPLARTRTKNEESLYWGPCAHAREFTVRLFGFFARTREGVTQKNGTRAHSIRSRARDLSKNLVFHLSIDEDESGQFVSPHGARPQKPETAARHSWLAARRKDDDGDDRVVTMRFYRCFIHAKTRLPRIQFFTGVFRMSLVTKQPWLLRINREGKGERRLPLKSFYDKNIFSCYIIELRICFGQLLMSLNETAKIVINFY